MTLHNRLMIQKRGIDLPKITFLTQAVLLSFLIALSAQIRVPFWPVPLTLQTTTILAIGLAYQPRLAIAAVIAYICEGACGLPVFQGMNSGLHYLFGPTGGYLFGFLPAVAIVSYLKGSQPTFGHLFKVCLLAKVPVYVLGVLWLSSFVGMKSAVGLGLLPFLLKVPVSIAFAIASSNLIDSFKQRFWP